MTDVATPAAPRLSTDKAPDKLPWPSPRIAVDTREQRPWRWGKLYSGERDPDSLVTELLGGPWHSELTTLGEGDYQLIGPDGRALDGVCAVERKSVADLRGSLSAGHDRFMREMERLAGWQTPLVVVEAPVEVLLGARSGLVEMLDSARAFLAWLRGEVGPCPLSDGIGQNVEAIADMLGHTPEEAQRPGHVSVRSLLGTTLSILTDHRVPVLFLPSREWAEYAAAWVLRRAWRRWLVDAPGRLEAERKRMIHV